MSRSQALQDERGMTLVEVLVAIVVLLIGIFGTVTMIDGANATTAKTKAREGSNAMGRGILEVARSVSYRNLTGVDVVAAASARPGFADMGGGSGYTVKSRNQLYDVTVDVCAVDDPKDGLGPHTDVDVDFCTDSTGSSSGTDRNPDDYRRVAISLTWDVANVTSTSKQTTIVTNPVGGFGPSITSLTPTNFTSPITNSALNNARFAATTSSPAADVSWAINGDVQGQASGSGTSWTIDWKIDKTKPDGAAVFPDCTYLVSAQAFDNKGRAGAPKAVTVTLNRFAPLAPRQFEGGRNLNSDRVDLQWLPNDECDVEGYRVYRGTSPGAINTLVCPASGTTPMKKTECLDELAPPPASGVTLYYQVVGVDKDSGGSLREGTRSAALAITEGDNPPSAPSNLVACAGGTPGCDDVNGDPVPDGSTAVTWDPSTDPDSGDAIYFYRIYRGGATYADRRDVFYPVANKPLTWVDNNAAGGPHDYRVSAVDLLFGESALSAPVTK
jgi:prepilin-type N-terminal cleavage/methylation domain-containing protein